MSQCDKISRLYRLLHFQYQCTTGSAEIQKQINYKNRFALDHFIQQESTNRDINTAFNKSMKQTNEQHMETQQSNKSRFTDLYSMTKNTQEKTMFQR